MVDSSEDPTLPLKPRTPARGEPQLPPDYELVGELGRGGMGVIYRVRQRSLGREVALKLLNSAEDSALRRFRNEARSLARLQHPNVVTIYEVGEVEGEVYFTMELVEGASVAGLLGSAPLSVTRSVHLLRQVGEAVAYAHSQGIIHRDLKPGNVLVDGLGNARVADFGLARDLRLQAGHTATGHILGTPAYMSPEQAEGNSAQVGELSDVYALGATLYACLCGRPPVEQAPLFQMVKAVLLDEPPALRSLNPGVPDDLVVICGKAMAKDPRQRYATAQAFCEDLTRFSEGRPILARPPSLGHNLLRFVQRNRDRVLASFLGGLLMAGILMALLPLLEDPQAELDQAARLLEAGEFLGAERFSQRALAVMGQKQVHDLEVVRGEYPAGSDYLLRRQAWESLITARLGRARRAMAEQAWEQAVALLEGIYTEARSVFSDRSSTLHVRDPQGQKVGPGFVYAPYLPRQPELLWLLAFCLQKLGKEAESEVTHLALEMSLRGAETFQRILAARQIQDLGEFGTIHSYGTGTTRAEARHILFDLALLRLSQPGLRELSLKTLSSLLEKDTESGTMGGDWLFQELRSPQPVVELLCLLEGAESQPDLVFAALERALLRCAAAGARDEVVELLRQSVEEEEGGERQRTAALELFCRFADLPLGHDALPQSFSEESAQAACELWDPIRDLSWEEAYRARLDAGFERYLNGQRSLEHWLEIRTGIALRDVADVRSAWEQRRSSEPRDWLLEALGLPLGGSFQQLFELMIEHPVGGNKFYDHRDLAVYHLLLGLLVPEELPRPPWPGRRFSAPQRDHELSPELLWHQALRLPWAPVRLRWAWLEQSAGADAPQLLKEHSVVLEPGVPFRLLEFDRGASEAFYLVLDPGVPGPGARLRSQLLDRSFELHATLQFATFGGGLEVEFETLLALRTTASAGSHAFLPMGPTQLLQAVRGRMKGEPNLMVLGRLETGKQATPLGEEAWIVELKRLEAAGQLRFPLKPVFIAGDWTIILDRTLQIAWLPFCLLGMAWACSRMRSNPSGQRSWAWLLCCVLLVAFTRPYLLLQRLPVEVPAYLLAGGVCWHLAHKRLAASVLRLLSALGFFAAGLLHVGVGLGLEELGTVAAAASTIGLIGLPLLGRSISTRRSWLHLFALILCLPAAVALVIFHYTAFDLSLGVYNLAPSRKIWEQSAVPVVLLCLPLLAAFYTALPRGESAE